jgi:hypothetical protein
MESDTDILGHGGCNSSSPGCTFARVTAPQDGLSAPTRGGDMAFVQIVEFQTSRADEMRKLGDEWESSAKDTSTARRRILCEDRDNPGHHFNIVIFDSYESAMENSNLPETTEFGQRQAALLDQPMVFTDLDVVADSS